MKALNKFIFVIALQFSMVMSIAVEADVIEEIVVIANKYPVPSSEVVGSVDLISVKDIEMRLASDLSDLLDKTIGVSVPRSNSYGRAYDEGISIRGLGGKRVNILVDGIRVADAYTGYGRDVVEIDLLKRVEILKGPSSALYGSDGLAGVVAYITKDPGEFTKSDESYLSITTSYDQASNNKKLGVLGAIAKDKLNGLVQITSRQLNELELHDESTLALNPLDGEQMSVLGKIKLTLTESIDLSMTLDLQEWEGQWVLNSDEGMSYFPAVVSTESSLGNDDGVRNRLTASLNFIDGPGLFDSGNLSVFAQETDQTQITVRQKMLYSFGPPTELVEFRDYRFNQSIKGLSVNLFKTIELFGMLSNTVYGIEIENSKISRPRARYEENLMSGAKQYFLGGEYYPNKTIPDTEIERSGIFFNNVVEWSAKTSIVFGARYDGYKLTPRPDALYEVNEPAGNQLLHIDDNKVSLKLGVIRSLSDNLSFFAQYAEGFRSPDYQAANLSFTNQAYRYAIESSPGLESETSEGIEFGLRGSFVKSTWSLAIYDNNYKDFIDTDIVRRNAQGISIYQYNNLNSVDIKGLEFRFNSSLSDNVRASFAFNITEGKEGDGAELLSVDPREALIGVIWDSPDGKMSVSGYASAVAGSPDDLPPSCGRSGCSPLLELSGLVTYDLYASYQIASNFKARVAIRNLTNEAYWNWASVRGKTANDPNIDLFMEPGRNINIAFRYEL